MSILAPLPDPGTHAQMQHPLLALACAAVACVLVVAFARGYAAANPPETAEAIRSRCGRAPCGCRSWAPSPSWA